MNSKLISLLIVFVSFLAVSLASGAEDEFDIFEKEVSKSPSATFEVKPTQKPNEASKTIDDLKAAVRKDPKNISLIQTLAVRLDEEKNTDGAIKLLWKYIDQIDDVHITKLATFEFKSKNSEQAIKAATLAVGKNKSNSEAWNILGKAQKSQGKNSEALESFKKSIEADNKNQGPYWELVNFYTEKKNLYEVRILLQDLIEAVGSIPAATNKICEINYLDKSYEAAVTSCREAILKDQNHPDSYVYLGLALKATGNDDKAIAQLKKAAMKFKNSELSQFHYAQELQLNKNHIEAYKYFKSAVAADEKSGRSWLGLGTEAFELQKFDDSLAALSKACKVLRIESATQLRKSVIFLRNSKYPEYLKKFEVATENCQFQ